MKKQSEIVFQVEASPEGGYERMPSGILSAPRGLSGGIARPVREAVDSHFEPKDRPTVVRFQDSFARYAARRISGKN
jgi:hypothetical protein